MKTQVNKMTFRATKAAAEKIDLTDSQKIRKSWDNMDIPVVLKTISCLENFSFGKVSILTSETREIELKLDYWKLAKEIVKKESNFKECKTDTDRIIRLRAVMYERMKVNYGVINSDTKLKIVKCRMKVDSDSQECLLTLILAQDEDQTGFKIAIEC
jgi:hypothetical protein